MITAEQKAARIARAKRHAAADMLRTGQYISDDASHGCSVGCDVLDILGYDPGSGYHAIVAEHDGTPGWLERLRDRIFEGLLPERRAWWHVTLAEALPVGVDMQPAYHEICIRILTLCLTHRATWAEPYGSQVAAAIEQTIEYHRQPNERTLSARSAENAALSAVRSAEIALSAENADWSTTLSARSAENAALSAVLSISLGAESVRSAVLSIALSAENADWSAVYEAIAQNTIDVLTSMQR